MFDPFTSWCRLLISSTDRVASCHTKLADTYEGGSGTFEFYPFRSLALGNEDPVNTLRIIYSCYFVLWSRETDACLILSVTRTTWIKSQDMRNFRLGVLYAWLKPCCVQGDAQCRVFLANYMAQCLEKYPYPCTTAFPTHFMELFHELPCLYSTYE